MEYYIYITKSCNLSCRYCCGRTIIRRVTAGSRITKQKSISSTVDYILNDVRKNGHEENTIVFYGGEPLLNQEDIIEVIRCTQDRANLKYFLYTNGVLLDTMTPFLLANIDYIVVSIDGEESLHNKNRGKNTYTQVMNNVKSISTCFKGETIARLTLTKDSKVDEAVFSLTDTFNHIFWQIENSGSTNMGHFAENYKKGVANLLAWWISHVQNGWVPNLVPFQAITSSIILGRRHTHFRCGFGHTLKVIDTDGDVHLCDEIMCDPELKADNYMIKDGFEPDDWIVEKLSAECNNCDVRYICGGRCAHMLLAYPHKKIRLYCELTNNTISKINDVVPTIREALCNKRISLQQIDTYVSRNGTEQIP